MARSQKNTILFIKKNIITEIYCSHENQTGKVFKLEVKPANIKKGIKMKGPTDIAVFISRNKLPNMDPHVKAIILAKILNTTKKSKILIVFYCIIIL